MSQADWKPDPKDVERRKNDLLAEARGETKGRATSSMAGAGLQFVVAVLFCLFVGQWLDGKLGTKPWLMIAGMLLGGGVGFWSLLRLARTVDGRGGMQEGGRDGGGEKAG
jgi:F0F1-type ATP synthase assembly protein I